MPGKVNSSGTGSDVIVILISSLLVMSGTVGFVSKRCIQKYGFIELYLFCFRIIALYLYRK